MTTRSLWERLGRLLLVAALSGTFTGCGDDDDGGDGAGNGRDAGGTSGAGAAGRSGGSGDGGVAGRSGGAGGTSGAAAVECSDLGDLPSECTSCIQDAVSNCGDECVALLNCTADKCGTATSESEQTACVSACCLTEATTAVGGPGGRDTLGAAQMAQRAACAAVCTGDDTDAGIDAGN